MKISISWLKELININNSTQEIATKLTASGLEVEGTHHFEQVKGGLEGLIIGQVIGCRPHDNADSLQITSVDIGNDAPLQIVCGAPNVATGQKVVVATVGSTIYPSEGEPFKIKKAKIRGEHSQGMICAEDEIGLGESHAGIMVLEDNAAVGSLASDYFQLQTTEVLEIGLTPNRADAASHLGVARELQALTKAKVKLPDLSNFKVDNSALSFKITVEDTAACPRYSGLSIADIQVAPSPAWLRFHLEAIGIKPINNVVDATNYVLHELGQPLHAFDAAAIEGNEIVVKNAQEGSVFTTLDEKERKLKASDLMICNANKPMCIAGVFGGIHSGVTDSTTAIFLESAYFSPDSIRKTAQGHGLKTDASFRYERGTDPEITVYALKRAALLIQSLAGGTISSEITDIYPEPLQPFTFPVRFEKVQTLIGEKIDHNVICDILTALDIGVEDRTATAFKAIVPRYRVDVQREADIAEEVLRIYGYDNIALSEHMNSKFLASFPKKDAQKYKNSVAELLSANGFYEIITNSLTNSKYFAGNPLFEEDRQVKILNYLSEELNIMRPSLLFSGLEVLAHNINRKQADLKCYEFGDIYFKKAEQKYGQENRLALFITGNTQTENWSTQHAPVTFHDLALQVSSILNRLGITGLETAMSNDAIFEQKQRISINGNVVAEMGLLRKSITKKLQIKPDVYYADIAWKKIIKLQRQDIVYDEVSKFPEVRRDLSLVLDKQVTFQEIKTLAEKEGSKLLQGLNVFDVYEGDKLPEGKKAYAISFTIQDKTKTLNDKQIDKIMGRLMSAFENELQAIIRK